MTYFKKSAKNIHFQDILHFFENNDFVNSEVVITQFIHAVNDNQSLTLAHLLRATLYLQKAEIDLAINDLKIALSKSFFDFDVLSLLTQCSQTGDIRAIELLHHTINVWLYCRPEDYVYPIILETLKVSHLEAFGFMQYDGHGNLTGWIHSSKTKDIVIEIDTAVIFHTCNDSYFFRQINKEIHTFSLKLPPHFTHCRVGILGENSLWGSPIVQPRTFTFSSVSFSSTRSKQLKTVDILIPVYKGFEETRACLESVYQTMSWNKTIMRLLVINDASPDSSLNTWLKKEANLGRITLIERAFNVGFVGAINTGLAHRSGDNDVVLLNADTLVASDWLDRLQTVSQREPNIGTVTPISNNAELLSYPHPMRSNPMPDLNETQLLDRLFSQLGIEQTRTIPSGVGFCLYICSDLLDIQPFFNEKLIQRGYGEETEFCLKAVAKGWKNVVATNVFVAHKGHVSFGEEKQGLAHHHVAQIHARFPKHSAEYARFLHQKPLKSLFEDVNQHRMVLS